MVENRPGATTNIASDLVATQFSLVRPDPAAVDPRFLLNEAKAALIESVIARTWPEQIDPADIGNEALAADVIAARYALLDALDLHELG